MESCALIFYYYNSKIGEVPSICKVGNSVRLNYIAFSMFYSLITVEKKSEFKLIISLVMKVLQPLQS